LPQSAERFTANFCRFQKYSERFRESSGLHGPHLRTIRLVHLPHGFDSRKGGIEYPLTQLLIALALLFAGAGRSSLAGLLPPSLRRL
jgi:hypothetical protein